VVVMGMKFPWRLMNGCSRPEVWIQENAENGKQVASEVEHSCN
jgi:hypothetical protein